MLSDLPPPVPPKPTQKPKNPPPPPTHPSSLVPRYNTAEKVWEGDPEAYAIAFPDSWEAGVYRKGKYPPLAAFK